MEDVPSERHSMLHVDHLTAPMTVCRDGNNVEAIYRRAMGRYEMKSISGVIMNIQAF